MALGVVLLLAAFAAPAAKAATAPGSTFVVGIAGWASGSSFFNVRASPTLTATVVGALRPGQQVSLLSATTGAVVGDDDVWYRVAWHGAGAYVHSSGISYVRAPPVWTGAVAAGPDASAGIVATRAAPRLDAPTDGSFALGTAIMALGTVRGVALNPGNDVWYTVSTGSYRPAYLYSADLSFVSPGLSPPPVPVLGAAAAYAIDMDTSRVLFARNADVPRAPASLAKMMTAAVALDRLAPDTLIAVPAGAPSVGAAVGGTAMGLIPGEHLSLRDLLYGMLLPSGNDAAYTIADAVAGSQSAFAGLMNAKAAALGLTGTHFVQGYGLDDPDQYSTARDLATLARYDLAHYPLFARIVATSSHVIGVGRTHPAFSLHNLDRLLGVYPGDFGVKTGTTPAAGQNLVAAVKRDGRRVMVVVLGSTDRYADATALLNYAVALDRYAPRG